jgi:hypothetical protein
LRIADKLVLAYADVYDPRFVVRNTLHALHALLPLRPRQIDAVLAKFGRALGETAPALGSFLWRLRGIDNLFDRLCGEVLSTQPPTGLADGPRWRLDLEAELYKPAGRRNWPKPCSS